MGAYIWLIIMGLLLVVELMVPGLVSIWFAGGALLAYLVSLVDQNVAVQTVVFVLSSVILLAATRPLAKKYLNHRVEKTNKDSIPGRKAVVTETVDNLKATGRVMLDGMSWMARSAQEDEAIPEGEEVLVDRIEGARCIVKRLDKGEEQ